MFSRVQYKAGGVTQDFGSLSGVQNTNTSCDLPTAEQLNSVQGDREGRGVQECDAVQSCTLSQQFGSNRCRRHSGRPKLW
jgi:hypothetical protein